MKVTVIPEDNTIVVDGDVRHPDDAVYPDGVHAIQWDEEIGFVEHVQGSQVCFVDFGYVEPFVVMHAAAKLRDETPMTDFVVQKAAETAKWKTQRAQMLSRVEGMAARFERAGDAESAASCDLVTEGLFAMFTHSTVTSATDIDTYKAALKARYLAAVSLASPAAKLEFKRYDQ